MIERDFIVQKTKEYYIKKEIERTLKGAGVSQIKLKKIPLGEKIIVHTSRPSLIVGSKGSNIRDLTKKLKKNFNLENPQIEIVEVKNIFLDAAIVAERIVSSLERFGSARFKGIGHKIMENVINSGALGIEIIISGKIPGSRAKNWRFYQGYLKKCGDVAVTHVSRAKKSALLKSGIIGIKVAIMPPDLDLPDTIEVLDEPIQIIEDITVEKKVKKDKKPSKKKKTAKKQEPKLENKVGESTKNSEAVIEETKTAVIAKETGNEKSVENSITDSKESVKKTNVEKTTNLKMVKEGNEE